ncbi:hypothetical protein BpHYR1_052446 [Brachionus plicatilis]|uniref:Uncharacterized protein n=1 Tax=Brachionus plicatilis TaxID=10195 RepID=A0A3M7QY95_BRAPC|nr:hypothetical protein BpHYR1_052446 [Brachionus plicatilis]
MLQSYSRSKELPILNHDISYTLLLQPSHVNMSHKSFFRNHYKVLGVLGVLGALVLADEFSTFCVFQPHHHQHQNKLQIHYLNHLRNRQHQRNHHHSFWSEVTDWRIYKSGQKDPSVFLYLGLEKIKKLVDND